MAYLKDFHKDILPDVQGCPISILNNALMNSIIDFCKGSQIWKEDLAPIDIVEDVAEYHIMTGYGERVVTVDYATFNGAKLYKIASHDLDKYSNNWREESTKQPTYFMLVSPEKIRLVGTPTESIPSGLVIYASLCPTRDATCVPDFLYEDWGPTIAHGALYRLHAMSNKTWANAGISGWHERKYRNGLSRARTQALKSLLNIDKQITPVSFYKG